MMLAGVLTDSPMWLPTAVYWLAWAFAHAVWWWLRTATLNMEAIAPAASIVYWLAVWYTFALTVWGWEQTKRSYGVREAVDLGENTRRLGRVNRRVVAWQTRARVSVAVSGLLGGAASCAILLAVGILGVWTFPAVALAAGVKVRRLHRRARWASP